MQKHRLNPLPGKHQPVNFRIVDKAEGKTKNDYFLDMLAEVLSWELEPKR